MLRLLFSTWVFLCVCTCSSCVHEMTKNGLDSEILKHTTETINNVWYVGSTEHYDFFVHNTALRSKKIKIIRGDIDLPSRFPLTKDKKQWVIVKSDTDF